jgi:hypothetical protein
MKPQWWVNLKDAAVEATKRTEAGELKVLPKSSEGDWYRWMRDMQDWCISRQLWWGHRCPAWLLIIDGQRPDVSWLSFFRSCSTSSDTHDHSLPMIRAGSSNDARRTRPRPPRKSPMVGHLLWNRTRMSWTPGSRQVCGRLLSRDGPRMLVYTVQRGRFDY